MCIEMGMISIKAHNVLDYVIGVVLILCPYIFGFGGIPPARNTFLVVGFGLIGYSLLTNYYYSALKLIPLPAHFALDVVDGLVLIFAPLIWGYRPAITSGQYAVHVIMGIGALVFVAFTNRQMRRGQVTIEEAKFRKTA